MSRVSCNRRNHVANIPAHSTFKLQFSFSFLCHFCDTHIEPFTFVLIGRVRRSGIALHPPLPLPPLRPLILHLSEVKSTWERGWSTRRRATVTHVILHGTTVGPLTEALEITRATTQREAEAVDL